MLNLFSTKKKEYLIKSKSVYYLVFLFKNSLNKFLVYIVRLNK
jgi:hypothetical protein